jgi:hypothetical protein
VVVFVVIVVGDEVCIGVVANGDIDIGIGIDLGIRIR